VCWNLGISKRQKERMGVREGKFFLRRRTASTEKLSLSFRSRLFPSAWEQPLGDLRVIYRVGRRNCFGFETSHLLVCLRLKSLFGGPNNGSESTVGGFKNGCILDKPQSVGHENPPRDRDRRWLRENADIRSSAKMK
jgi:hypothetical protein